MRLASSEFQFSMQLVALKERPNSLNKPKRWTVRVYSKPSSRLATAAWFNKFSLARTFLSAACAGPYVG